MMMTTQYLQQVRQAMPRLSFNPQTDTPVSAWPLARTYLDHYGMDFSAEYPQVAQVMGAFETQGFRLACHYWSPPQPVATVYVVHGYFDHLGLYGHLFRYLLQKNYRVVSFDLPGHGLSSGEVATIDSFDQYEAVFVSIYHQASQHFPGPHFAVGQSTGGAILIKALLRLRADNPFAGVSLLAPLVHPRYWRFNRLLYLASYRYRKQVSRKFMVNSSDLAFVDFLETKDPLQARHLPVAWVGAMKRWIEDYHGQTPCDFPVRIIQGDRDTTLDWRHNLKSLAKKFPRSQVTVIPGAGHHLVNETEMLRQDIFAALGL